MEVEIENGRRRLADNVRAACLHLERTLNAAGAAGLDVRIQIHKVTASPPEVAVEPVITRFRRYE